jgi:hypothetical protein
MNFYSNPDGLSTISFLKYDSCEKRGEIERDARRCIINGSLVNVRLLNEVPMAREEDGGMI